MQRSSRRAPGLAIASKDGDWILREDQEAVSHVLAVLERHGARYRFGAPLDLRWLRGGWSSYFQFQTGAMRVRTDLFTRPPRVTPRDLADLWRGQEGRDPPFTPPRFLIEMKKTAHEQDWPIVGELARMLSDPREQMLCSRSARDLLELDVEHPRLASELARERPLLRSLEQGLDALRTALDRERRDSMDADDRRIRSYLAAAGTLQQAWPSIQARCDGRTLGESHRVLVEWAELCLPITPDSLPPGTDS